MDCFCLVDNLLFQIYCRHLSLFGLSSLEFDFFNAIPWVLISFPYDIESSSLIICSQVEGIDLKCDSTIVMRVQRLQILFDELVLVLCCSFTLRSLQLILQIRCRSVNQLLRNFLFNLIYLSSWAPGTQRGRRFFRRWLTCHHLCRLDGIHVLLRFLELPEFRRGRRYF